MSSLLLVIDLQKGFVNEKTEYLVEKINHLIQRNLYDQIAFTRFINTPQSVLAKKLFLMIYHLKLKIRNLLFLLVLQAAVSQHF